MPSMLRPNSSNSTMAVFWTSNALPNWTTVSLLSDMDMMRNLKKTSGSSETLGELHGVKKDMLDSQRLIKKDQECAEFCSLHPTPLLEHNDLKIIILL